MQLPGALLSPSPKKKSTPKKDLKISYISRNGTFYPYIYFTFQELTFRARKIKSPTLKKFIIFQEMKLSSPKLKNLYFRKKIAKTGN